jgi:GNAT superfamily N-acetyltransferase
MREPASSGYPDKIISSCYLAIIPNLTRNGKSNGFIENVITDEKYRNMGIGKGLIKMAVEYGKQNNCYKIILQSSLKRKENHIFYEIILTKKDAKPKYNGDINFSYKL